jgi:hypothetical protein
MLVRSLLAAAVGGAVFQRINIPAGALIGAMVGVAAVGLSGTATVGPGPYLRFVAFAIIGWELGSQIDRSTLESVRSAAVPILVVVGGLLAAAGVLALILHAAGLDPITSFLAASPGGLSQMAAMAAEFKANAVVVTIVHLVRLVAVILMTPLVVKLLS